MEARFTLRFSQAEDSPYDMAATPVFAQDGLCFVACGSGLYRAGDAGASWERLRASSESVTTAVAVSPAFADDRSVFAAVKGGVLRSSDGGDNWYTASFPAPPPLFSSLIVSPDFARDGFLLASTLEDGVFSSTDRGLRWQSWNFGLFDLSVLCLALSPAWSSDETVFAGTETGLYRSANGGRAWRPTGFPTELAPVLSLACLTDNRSATTRLLAGTESHGLLASCDRGETWKPLAADAISGAVNQLQIWQSEGADPSIYALVEAGLLRSDDLGRTWDTLFRAPRAPSVMLRAGDVILLGIPGDGVLRLSVS
ncbi:MAG: hypothetical protein OXG85_08920 [Chloroflexi bacterium]|nr:hypothetical protein [Chloroflexota bacterium]